MNSTVSRKPVENKTPEPRDEKKLKKEKKGEGKKEKVIRDSFSMPQEDYELIGILKQKAVKSGLHMKKSELLRVGLQVLNKMTAPRLKQALMGVEKLKTGRPKKD